MTLREYVGEQYAAAAASLTERERCRVLTAALLEREEALGKKTWAALPLMDVRARLDELRMDMKRWAEGVDRESLPPLWGEEPEAQARREDALRECLERWMECYEERRQLVDGARAVASLLDDPLWADLLPQVAVSAGYLVTLLLAECRGEAAAQARLFDAVERLKNQRQVDQAFRAAQKALAVLKGRVEDQFPPDEQARRAARLAELGRRVAGFFSDTGVEVRSAGTRSGYIWDEDALLVPEEEEEAWCQSREAVSAAVLCCLQPFRFGCPWSLDAPETKALRARAEDEIFYYRLGLGRPNGTESDPRENSALADVEDEVFGLGRPNGTESDPPKNSAPADVDLVAHIVAAVRGDGPAIPPEGTSRRLLWSLLKREQERRRTGGVLRPSLGELEQLHTLEVDLDRLAYLAARTEGQRNMKRVLSMDRAMWRWLRGGTPAPEPEPPEHREPFNREAVEAVLLGRLAWEFSWDHPGDLPWEEWSWGGPLLLDYLYEGYTKGLEDCPDYPFAYKLVEACLPGPEVPRGTPEERRAAYANRALEEQEAALTPAQAAWLEMTILIFAHRIGVDTPETDRRSLDRLFPLLDGWEHLERTWRGVMNTMPRSWKDVEAGRKNMPVYEAVPLLIMETALAKSEAEA